MTTNEPLIDKLHASLQHLREVLANVPEKAIRYKASPGQWSVLEIISHLADAERFVFRERLTLLLADPKASLEKVDTTSWREEHKYAEQEYPAILKQFELEREENIRMLESVSLEKWNLEAPLGKHGILKMSDIVRLAGDHTERHIEQIRRVLQQYEQSAAGR